MKKRLLFAAALMIAMVPSFSRKAEALASRCFAENYGSGQCGTTCVYYNDQGSAVDWCTTLHGC
jgi:hypothetical protein